MIDRPRRGDPCAIEDCHRPILARGWCSRHYQRWRLTGDPLGSQRSKDRRDAWQHGSRRGYDQGCRCFPCRIAENRYQQLWMDSGGIRTSAATIAAHVQLLLASGWTRRDLAEEADLNYNTLWYVTSGRSKNVNSKTATALLSIDPLPGAQLLDVTPLVEAFATRKTNMSSLPAAARRAMYRAKRTGTITETMADLLAVKHLNLTLEEVYGFDWEQGHHEHAEEAAESQ
jgi:hypothetical protein